MDPPTESDTSGLVRSCRTGYFCKAKKSGMTEERLCKRSIDDTPPLTNIKAKIALGGGKVEAVNNCMY